MFVIGYRFFTWAELFYFSINIISNTIGLVESSRSSKSAVFMTLAESRPPLILLMLSTVMLLVREQFTPSELLVAAEASVAGFEYDNRDVCCGGGALTGCVSLPSSDWL